MSRPASVWVKEPPEEHHGGGDRVQSWEAGAEVPAWRPFHCVHTVTGWQWGSTCLLAALVSQITPQGPLTFDSCCGNPKRIEKQGYGLRGNGGTRTNRCRLLDNSSSTPHKLTPLPLNTHRTSCLLSWHQRLQWLHYNQLAQCRTCSWVLLSSDLADCLGKNMMHSKIFKRLSTQVTNCSWSKTLQLEYHQAVGLSSKRISPCIAGWTLCRDRQPVCTHKQLANPHLSEIFTLWSTKNKTGTNTTSLTHWLE